MAKCPLSGEAFNRKHIVGKRVVLNALFANLKEKQWKCSYRKIEKRNDLFSGSIKVCRFKKTKKAHNFTEEKFFLSIL